MGLSVSAAGVVLLAGLLYFGAQTTNAYLSAQSTVRGGLDDARDHFSDVKQASISIASVSYSAAQDRSTITVTNTGSVTFDGSKVDVVLDGVVRTTDILTRLVEGVTTDVWAPAQDVVIVVQNVVSSPNDIVVATGTGAMAFWRN